MKKFGMENFDYENHEQPPFGKGTNDTEKEIVQSILNPIDCEKYLKIIINLINDGYKIRNILDNLKNFTPKDTNFRPNTYNSIDFYQKYSISKEDIPILEETLKIYDECETIYKLITTPIDDFCVSNNSEDNPEDNQLNIGVYFGYSYRNGEFSISSGDVDKLAHKYKEAENFRLKPGAIVYSLNSEEKNINIDDLINDDYIIIKGTYVRIDYSNNNKYAFYVKIRSKTTGKEYITYSI